MSLVSDQVRRLDAYLDRWPALSEGALSSEEEAHDADINQAPAAAGALSGPRVDRLSRIVQSLSTTASATPLLPIHRVRALLEQSELSSTHNVADDAGEEAAGALSHHKTTYENDIEWLLVSKATVHVYGNILNVLFDRIVPLSDDIWYWSDVLNTYAYSSLYTIQTSPLRWWDWSRDVYSASEARFRRLQVFRDPAGLAGSTATRVSRQWRHFYTIVRDSIRERSLSDIQRRVLSPVALCRSQVRRKQAQLRKLREVTASGLGVLVDEGLHFDFGDIDDDKSDVHGHQDVKGIVERSVALMDVVLKEGCTANYGTMEEFEDIVFAGVEEDPELSIHLEDSVAPNRPAVVARRLLRIIDGSLPEYVQVVQALARTNGRPSRLVRYWLPAVAGALFSTTLLRILVNRRADIVNWIRDIGVTARDFWFNWIVEPTQKVVRTIRHDETSEIAIMSRDSLKADRESLERMVVDFAVDKPHFAVAASSLSEADVAEIRGKVAEGDVTPVLRAYEKDLRRPFVGAIRGDLVRSLLIQVQKTKVDLEVAMTGIDSLLKSQELVFGFVGLTPGVLVTIGVLQYLRGVLGGRTGLKRSAKAGRMVRALRNIDRILSEARPAANSNVLSYKDHGLLLCEVHLLRSLAGRLMAADVYKEFVEDLDDLANIKGIQVQAKALDRIRWAYSRWIQ